MQEMITHYDMWQYIRSLFEFALISHDEWYAAIDSVYPTDLDGWHAEYKWQKK